MDSNATMGGKKRVLVIGAGVIGSTTAYKLLEKGYDVTILAKDFAKKDYNITSEVAGALWEYPPWCCGRHAIDMPLENPTKWAMASYKDFGKLAKNSEETGVFWRDSYYYFPKQVEDMPEEIDKFHSVSKLPGFRHSASLIEDTGVHPQDYMPVKDAYSHEAPVIDAVVFMEWVYKQCKGMGAKLVNGEVHGLLKDQVEELKKKFEVDLIVNCTGLGSRELAGDDKMYPIRGCCLKIKNDGVLMPVMTHSLTMSVVEWMNPDDETDESNWLVYFIPRGDHSIWVGGIVEPDKTDMNVDLSYEPLKKMLEKAKAFYPPFRAFKDEDIEVVVCGLRPGRHGGEICCEIDSECQSVIHNYGHAGAGFILSWGCAIDAACLVDKAARQ